MTFRVRQLRSGLYGIYDTVGKQRVFVCNRAFNAHLIAEILDADEKQEVVKGIEFKELR